MANFDDQVMGLTGLTVNGSSTAPSQAELTTFLTDGAKEIINILPPDLKIKCAAASTLNNSTTVMDMDGTGQVLFVTRLSANSGGYQVPCREIPYMYGGLATDSSSLYYATVTDPVYWIDGNTSDASTLYVKPTPEATQIAYVHHISYPSVAYNNSVIVNFPDEAEYLVVLYAAIKSIQSTMGGMNASIIHSDQDGSYSASSASSQGWEKVRDWLEDEEDSEMAAATIQALGSEMQQFVAEYQWYQSQQKKLQEDYDKGIQFLVSQGIPQQAKQDIR